MSVKVKYKGEQILSLNTDTEKALATEGQYCEGDIVVENVQDGGITPSGTLPITENGTYDVTEYASADVNVSGGTEITDGIVVKERDANGYAKSVEHYGEYVFPYQFGANGNYGFPKLTTINMKKAISAIYDYGLSSSTLTTITPINWGESIITIGQYAFRYVKIRTLNFPNATTIGTSTFANVETEELYLPKITQITLSAFNSAKNLTVLQIGSVGYGITRNASSNSFANVTQSGLTITMFTNGSNADALLSSVRTSATAATIIIKASEDTTYNGVSYAAGDTMITSEVA